MEVMKTQRLQIRKFKIEDLENLFLLLSDERVMKYIEPPFSRKKTSSFLQEAALGVEPLIYAIEDRNGEFVGYVIYHKFDERTFEIGWVLGTAHWKQGYANELTHYLIAFSRGKVDRLLIECSALQEISKKIALKNGSVFAEKENGIERYILELQ